MSMEFWYFGRLEYRDRAAIDAVRAQLSEEGCVGHEDNMITDADLTWTDRVLTVESRGSMPYSCFQISSYVLSIYAHHASEGEVTTLNVEDGEGERHLAGGESIELDDGEIAALQKAYGWDEE